MIWLHQRLCFFLLLTSSTVRANLGPTSEHVSRHVLVLDTGVGDSEVGLVEWWRGGARGGYGDDLRLGHKRVPREKLLVVETPRWWEKTVDDKADEELKNQFIQR